MSLKLMTGGTYVPHLRWMASIPTWTLSVEGGEHQPIQFKQALIDLWNIQTLWAKFEKDQAPKWVIDPDLSTPADKPGEGWGRGFAVHVYNSKLFDGQNVREFATSATGASMAMQALHAEFEEQRKDHNRGEVPNVQFSGATPTKVGRGQTSVPQLQIVGWTARPVDLPDRPPAPAGSTPSPAPTGTAAQAEPVQNPPAAAQSQTPINDGNQLF